jgi:hypothetical protein
VGATVTRVGATYAAPFITAGALSFDARDFVMLRDD